MERTVTSRNGQHEGELVLDDVALFLRRFVAFPSAAAQTAVALWAAHAHMVGVFESTPRLAVLSPEPGSGKTRVLEVLELLVPLPVHVLNASPAAIFRLVAQSRPTLLFDEVDAVFGRAGGKGDDASEDLRGLLNAGHRRSATVPRCVGPTHAVEHFSVYAAVALAGLGNLPDTLMSRSVVIRMHRRAPGEHVESFRRRLAEPPGHQLRDRLAAWAENVAQKCGEAWPTMPDGITDRAADVWEPLLAVADAAGGSWPQLARDACLELNRVRAEAAPSTGIRLLADLRRILVGHDRMFSATVVERLNAIEDAGWSKWNRGEGIRQADLARILRGYDIESKNVRIGEDQRKGYERAWFEDAFTRYLPPLDAESATTTPVGTRALPSHVPELAEIHASDQGWDGGTARTASGGKAAGRPEDASTGRGG